jgi:hypothetical protein
VANRGFSGRALKLDSLHKLRRELFKISGTGDANGLPKSPRHRCASAWLPSRAADLLNVSRRYLIGLLEDGLSRFAGSANTAASCETILMAYKRKDDADRRQIADLLPADAQELGLGYGWINLRTNALDHKPSSRYSAVPTGRYMSKPRWSRGGDVA